MSLPHYVERNHESFRAHTPLRVGGTAKRWMWIYSEEGLTNMLSLLKKERETWMLHWPFQDVICKKGGYSGTVLRLAGIFSRIHYHEDHIELGSAVLWSQLSMGYERVFGLWSGSVGGLFSQQEEHLLSTYKLQLRWLKGKKIIEEDIAPKGSTQWSKKNSILLSIKIFGTPRKRKFTPTQTGMLYKTGAKNSIQDIFVKHNLPGIRLKDWLLCPHTPGRIIQLGAGDSKDLLLLSQGIKERIKKIGGKNIALRVPLIGKEN